MMSQRRFHRKSRHGCLQCKNNRKKCDENRPQCGRCERTGLACSLVDPTSDPTFIPAKPPYTPKVKAHTESSESTATPCSLSHEPSNSSPKDPPPIPISNELPTPELHFTPPELTRLRLIAHYTTYTSPTLTSLTLSSDISHTLWRDYVSNLALTPSNTNAFLLHGLLSLSALHLSLLKQSPKANTLLAIHHHDLGLSLFRPQLVCITAENYDSIFAFSYIIAFYSFGIYRSGADPISRLLQVLRLIRGSSVMVKASHKMLEGSRWSVMIPSDPFALAEQSALPEDVEEMLSTLLSRVPKSDEQEEDIYTPTILTLRSNLCIALSSPRSQLTVTFFPNLSPAAFWNESCTTEPLGLAILANYAVILHSLRDSIWMEGWGRETVNAIQEAMPVEWHDCLAWAVRKTECGDD